MAERLDLLYAIRSATGCCGPRRAESQVNRTHASLHYLSPSVRDGAAVARQAHNLKVVGSNPTPATSDEPMAGPFAEPAFVVNGCLAYWMSGAPSSRSVAANTS